MARESINPIETERLLLRPMVAEDLDAFLHVFADPTTMESSFSREQMEHWTQRNLDHQSQHGYGLFSVILKSDGLLIGDCGLEWMEVEGISVPELGYDFRCTHWNNGYATEAAKALQQFAFGTLKLQRLVSLIRVGNLASRRVAEKTGMELLHEIIRYESRYWLYGMTRST